MKITKGNCYFDHYCVSVGDKFILAANRPLHFMIHRFYWVKWADPDLGRLFIVPLVDRPFGFQVTIKEFKQIFNAR